MRLVAKRADAVVAVSESIADEVRSFEPEGVVRVIPNGSDFDDFAGLEYRPGERFRITHTGSFFGKRNPRAFLTALASIGPRGRDRALRRRLPLGRPRVGGGARARRPARADRLPAAPRALELQRDSEANLLLLPDAAGRGRVVPSGKVFEYLAAERPILAAVPTDGAAAELVRETGAGVVVAPEDDDGHPRGAARAARALAAGRLQDGS